MEISFCVVFLTIFSYNFRATESTPTTYSSSVSAQNQSLSNTLKRLPSDSDRFEEIRKNNAVYVDKTRFIRDIMDLLNNTNRYLLFTRPKQFGKSTFLDMLRQFILGKADLFQGTDIFERGNKLVADGKWEKHPVIYLNFKELSARSVVGFDFNLEEKFKEIATEHNLTAYKHYDIANLIQNLYGKYNQKVSILIDEYDFPFSAIDENETENLKWSYLAFFRQIKGVRRHNVVELVFIMGESKLSCLIDGLNLLTDLTFDNRFSTAAGFTIKEIKEYLKPYLKQFAVKNEMRYLEVLGNIMDYYHGYRFSFEGCKKVLNPVPIIFTLSNQKSWRRPSSAEEIVNEMKKFHPTMDIFESYRIKESSLRSYYSPKKIPIEVKLFNNGYLTIQNFEQKSSTVTLDFPNSEIKQYLIEHFGRNPITFSVAFNEAVKYNNIEKFINYLNEFCFRKFDSSHLNEDISEHEAARTIIIDMRWAKFGHHMSVSMKSNDSLIEEDNIIQIETINPRVAIEIKKSKPYPGTITAMEKLLRYTFQLRAYHLGLMGLGISYHANKRSKLDQWIYVPSRNGIVYMDELQVSSKQLLKHILGERSNQTSMFSSPNIVWGNLENKLDKMESDEWNEMESDEWYSHVNNSSEMKSDERNSDVNNS